MSRFALCLALFAGACLLTARDPAPLGAQEKKDKKDTAALERQLRAAQLELQQAAQQFNALKAANARLQAENNRLEALLKKEKKDDGKDDKALKALQTTVDGFRGAGLVHVVILKLRPDAPASEAQSLIDDASAQLSKLKPVRGLWAGRPAAKGAADAAGDYTVALVLLFDNAAGLRAYQSDPAHTRFADKHLKKWEAPLVYDFEPKKAGP